MFLLVRYSCLVVFLLAHGRVKKTRTRPWTSTGQVRLRARTSTGSARCRRLPEVELVHDLELVRGLTPAPRSLLCRHGTLPHFFGFGLAGSPAQWQSPGSRNVFLASRGSGLDQNQNRPWLGLVDLSRIPIGIFFREVHPGSEMASQNDQNKAKR